MKNLRLILAAALTALAAAGCTSAFYGSAGYYDDLYATHDRAAIANRRKAEAEARQAEAEARKAEAEARQAEWNAQLAQIRATSSDSDNSDRVIVVEDNPAQSFVADSYESAYARRLRGFTSLSYRMPSSYFNLRYGGSYTFATAYDPAFYNVMVSGDEVWVEPKYITSMFGTWGATNATAMLYSPWYYGWSRHYDPWYYSWWGFPRYSWYDWNWSICYGWDYGWGPNIRWGWGGLYHPWHHYPPHYHRPGPGGPHWGPDWGFAPNLGGGGGYWHRGGNYYGSRNNGTRLPGGGNTQPSHGNSIVNRGSANSTPYRSPNSGTSYGTPSRGTGSADVRQQNTGSAGRGTATTGRNNNTSTRNQTAVDNSSRNNSSRNNDASRNNSNNSSYNNNSNSGFNTNRGTTSSFGSGSAGGSSSRGGGGFSGGGSGGGSRSGGSRGR